jgi:hypothetical protein
MGIGVVAAAVALSGSPGSAAEKQIRPFVGVTFGGSTTLLDPEKASGKPNPAIGVSAVWVGEIFGVEADFARAPGFFESSECGGVRPATGNSCSNLVLSSSVTTATGNVMVAAPRSWTEYTLRPYFVGGAGLMRVHRQDYFDVFNITNVYAATDVGGGASGFITNRVGVCWEARYFRAISRKTQTSGVAFGEDELSFWRASMAIVIRY